MQPMERKRQGYIHELIQTEERYVSDLQLVVEVSVARLGLGQDPWNTHKHTHPSFWRAWTSHLPPILSSG